MNANEKLLTDFYQAFQKRDFATVQSFYADSAKFSDPVFVGLNAEEVKAMWEMLFKRGKDLEFEFSNVRADDQTGSADLQARYTFSATGRKVTNRIHAEIEFENGKIVKHTDWFSFYNWARQALGPVGLLLGWTPMIRNKVRKTARKSLAEFMAKQ